MDTHGNVQLSGTGVLGDLLADMIKQELKIGRVRADTFGYLQRSFPGISSEVDAKEAFDAGKLAVRYAVSGNMDGSVAIKRKPGKKYAAYFELVNLNKVAKNTRSMPASFINKAGNDVTADFINYAKPLVGRLPEVGFLKKCSVLKK